MRSLYSQPLPTTLDYLRFLKFPTPACLPELPNLRSSPLRVDGQFEKQRFRRLPSIASFLSAMAEMFIG